MAADAQPRRFVHRLRVRYHECDLQGVVFNANYFAYFDIALTEFMRATIGAYQQLHERGLDLVVASASASFRAPARFDDELDVSFVPERLGDSSLTSAIEIARDRELLAQGRMVHVFVELNTQCKLAIPGWVREALAPWSLPLAEGAA